MNPASLDAYFNRIYEFKDNGWSLPADAYAEEKWFLMQMQVKKSMLNSVKNKLDNFDLSAWSLHTKMRDPSTAIIKNIRNSIQPELLTQAWCKFYECLSKYPNIIPEYISDELKTLHLCEAPGGFVSALNHYLHLHYPKVKFEWYASTLNPNYEGNPLNRMIPDDRLINWTKSKWLFGADLTGDITKDYNYVDLTDKILRYGKVDLVTADGSVNCMDNPGDQERVVEHLHYCETITALTVLNTGGSFILKIFTTFEESTICLLYLLNCCFQSVRIFKPITSKSGNSETYVICLRYKGFSMLDRLWTKLILPYKNPICNSMFSLKDIDQTFIQQIEECSQYFMDKQIFTINENIKNFVNKRNAFYENILIKTLQEDITNHFLSIYYLDSIPVHQKLVPTQNVNPFNKTYQTTKNLQLQFKSYYLKMTDFKINFMVGKRIDKIFYSKYSSLELLEGNLLTRSNSKSLFTLCREALRQRYYIIDNCDYMALENWEFEKKLLLNIFHNVGHNMIFLNVPLRSSLLANVMYLLCNNFQQNYFFKGGIIVLNNYDATNATTAKQVFNDIERFYESANDCDIYKKGLIEILDEMNVNFIKCLWFYNNNLLLKN